MLCRWLWHLTLPTLKVKQVVLLIKSATLVDLSRYLAKVKQVVLLPLVIALAAQRPTLCCCVCKASYCCYGVVCADILRHGVELQAHLSSQGDALVLVLPWCEYEETALGTGLIVLVSWTGEVIEAPRCEEYKRLSCVERSPHHHLLALRYGRRHENGPAASLR